MSDITKLIGILFLIVLFFGAIIVDVLNWTTLVYGIPVIGLEMAFFISAFFDAISDKVNC